MCKAAGLQHFPDERNHFLYRTKVFMNHTSMHCVFLYMMYKFKPNEKRSLSITMPRIKMYIKYYLIPNIKNMHKSVLLK